MNRLTNSAARCCASAALPPLPKKKSLFPPARARVVIRITAAKAAACRLTKRRCAEALDPKMRAISRCIRLPGIQDEAALCEGHRRGKRGRAVGFGGPEPHCACT